MAGVVLAFALLRAEPLLAALDEARAQQRALLAEARRIWTYGWGASYVAAEHLALKLRRMDRHARAIQTTGFRLADDLVDIGPGEVVVVFAPGRLLTDVEVLMDRARTVGAKCIMLSDQLVDQIGDDVTVEDHVVLPPVDTALDDPFVALVGEALTATGLDGSPVETARYFTDASALGPLMEAGAATAERGARGNESRGALALGRRSLDWLLNAYAGLALIYLLVPIAIVVLFSFNDPRGRFNYVWQDFTLDNWLDWDAVLGLRESVVVSLQIGLLATLVATALGTLIALAIA